MLNEYLGLLEVGNSFGLIQSTNKLRVSKYLPTIVSVNGLLSWLKVSVLWAFELDTCYITPMGSCFICGDSELKILGKFGNAMKISVG